MISATFSLRLFKERNSIQREETDVKTNPSLKPKKPSMSCGALPGSISLVLLAVYVVVAPFNACNAGAPSPTPLTPSEGAGSTYGQAVALENGVAVSGERGDDQGGFSAGAAYVFVRNGGAWDEQKKLIPNDAAAGDLFGTSVDISFRTVVVGAEAKASRRGAAYVFVSNGSNWTQQAKFTALNPRLDDLFGHSVAISADTVLVGFPGD